LVYATLKLSKKIRNLMSCQTNLVHGMHKELSILCNRRKFAKK